MLRANPNPAIIDLFKVDRLQIIVVAKKYISTCRNCSSVGCLKCVQFHNCANPTVAPEVRSQNT